MQKKVIKKSGKREKFSRNKLKRSLARAVKDARVPEYLKHTIIEETTYDLLQYVNSFDEVTTAKIRDIILFKLQQMHPAVVMAWIAYELQKISEQVPKEMPKAKKVIVS